MFNTVNPRNAAYRLVWQRDDKRAPSDRDGMKRTFPMFVPIFMRLLVFRPGYEHWTAQQFRSASRMILSHDS